MHFTTLIKFVHTVRHTFPHSTMNNLCFWLENLWKLIFHQNQPSPIFKSNSIQCDAHCTHGFALQLICLTVQKLIHFSSVPFYHWQISNLKQSQRDKRFNVWHWNKFLHWWTWNATNDTIKLILLHETTTATSSSISYLNWCATDSVQRRIFNELKSECSPICSRFMMSFI